MKWLWNMYGLHAVKYIITVMVNEQNTFNMSFLIIYRIWTEKNQERDASVVSLKTLNTITSIPKYVSQ